MKIIAIGDIHGRTDWKEIVKNETDADKIIFVGDYFDTHENISAEQQLINFQEIVETKKQKPEKFTLLIGNHDFHYLTPSSERYSGFQDLHKIDIKEKLNEAKELLQMCFVWKNFLFVHAGVTKNWCSNNQVAMSDIQNSINILYKIKPMAFKFTVGKNRNVYGDDICQTPIWVRPNSLLKDMIDGYTQVVGHTTQNEIDLDDRAIFIDALGTSGEYLQIIDDEVTTKSFIKA